MRAGWLSRIHACAPRDEDGVKRRYRLTDKTRFRQVRQEGSSYAHPLMVLCVLANQGSVSRCGFTVSRRIGNAVERNRARRRIREAVRSLWDVIQPGWDMVWIARPTVKGAGFDELQSASARLLRRAHVLAPDPDPCQGAEPCSENAPDKSGTPVSSTGPGAK